jgi:hypothetical protein
MADVAGFCFDIGLLTNFRSIVGKLNFSSLIVYAEIFYFFLFANIGDDLVDVIPGIDHHGVMGTQGNGIRQSVCPFENVFHDPFLLIPDTEKSPGGHTDKKSHPYR